MKDKRKTIVLENLSQHLASIVSLFVQQRQDMITNSNRAQYGRHVQNYLSYSKPYTKRINNLTMPNGFQPPKFQQFVGKGNLKEHIAHFIETYENVGTRGDLLVKQFVRTLKENAFNWYVGLKSKTIDSWDQFEREFLSLFQHKVYRQHD